MKNKIWKTIKNYKTNKTNLIDLELTTNISIRKKRQRVRSYVIVLERSDVGV